MKRLFFALWPDDITRQQCINISNVVPKESARPILPANLHVTLLFLGFIDSDKETVFRQKAATIPVPIITLCFNQLSFWKRSGILCLTATDVSLELIALVDNLLTVARDLEISVDERPFTPHVTLIKKAKELATVEFEPVNWCSKSFCLVESYSQPNGVEYRIIEHWDANN